MNDNTTLAHTRFSYSDHHKLPFSVTRWLLYHPVTVCHFLSIEKKLTVEPAEILDVEEWAYVLRVRVKGRRYTMLSKKKLHEKCCKDADWGDMAIALSPRLAPIVEADDKTVVGIIGYHHRELAEKAIAHILKYELASRVDLHRAVWVGVGEWEVQAIRTPPGLGGAGGGKEKVCPLI